jgi:polysaccharide biosynthesis/export protein
MKSLIVSFAFMLATAGVAAASSSTYLIHAGDQLAVSVYGETALTQSVTVLPDGCVNLPLAGKVRVAGYSTDAASKRLAHALAPFIRRPMVTIEVASEGQVNALVLGDVKTPGKYSLRGNAHLTDAIAAAGGLDAGMVGELPVARVQTDGGAVRTISMQSLLRDGDESLDVTLGSNSVVYVQSRATFAIEVVGAVDRPGALELHEGDRLSIAIAKAGNSANAQSDLSHVFVTRNAAGHATTTQVDMYRALEHGDLVGDPKLAQGDVVYVPQAKKPGTSGSSIFNFLRLILGF